MRLVQKFYIYLLLVFMTSNMDAGFGKGFAAGAGTFFGVSLLSNAIANSRQPRTVVYTQPSYPQNQQFNYEIDEELEARRIEQERFFSQQAAQLSREQQKNERLKLEIERERLELEKQKLALKKNSKN